MSCQLLGLGLFDLDLNNWLKKMKKYFWSITVWRPVIIETFKDKACEMCLRDQLFCKVVNSFYMESTSVSGIVVSYDSQSCTQLGKFCSTVFCTLACKHLHLFTCVLCARVYAV